MPIPSHRSRRDRTRPSLAIVIVAFALVTAPLPVHAEDAPTVAGARALMQEQKYDEAVEVLSSVVTNEPENPRAWYLLGFANHARGAFGDAVAAYEQALAHGAQAPTTAYNLACAHAKLGHTDEALACLDRAAEAGFNDLTTLDGDTDLASLRDDARFAAAREKIEAAAHPCDNPEHRRFDFWIGDWDVFQNGQLAGTSHVARISGGCALLENWTDANGGTGHSMNFYDPAADRWKQTWVGEGAWILEFAEVDDDAYVDDGDMCFVATGHGPKGQTSLTRMTFFDEADGTVRQFMERSTDDGATWTPAFDGRYVRKDSAEANP